MWQASLLMRFTKLITFATLCLSIFSVHAIEKTYEPTTAFIYELAKQTIADKITTPPQARINIIPQVISRFNPPQCQGKLKATLSGNQGISRNNTVKISCQTAKSAHPWSMYLSVKTEILYSVVVAKNQLNAGEKLTQDKLQIKWVEVSGLRGAQYNDTKQPEGARTKRRVAQGAPLYQDNLCFVCKGDTVAIFARNAGFTIKAQGEALGAGIPGDRIRIINSRSNKTLSAIVIGIGKVEVKI